MPKDLLLEIGTEEIPAGFLPTALASMHTLVKDALAKNRLKSKDIKTLGTPRRLVIIASKLVEEQADTVAEITGPPKRAAFDDEGRPTKVAIGFAKRHGVELKDTKIIETKKGEYLSITKMIKGRETKEILHEILPSIINSIHFPKVMRWGMGKEAFARPIHWILPLYGGEIIGFALENVKGDAFSRGHRFLRPKPFRVDGVRSYLKKLKASYVIVDPKERVALIQEGIEEAASKVNGRCLEDEALLKEVSNLVEFPVVLMGMFDKAFLNLPKDVVINTMKEHQRYFPVVNIKGELMPHFITVANTKVKDANVIIKGNERVLKARLNDATFYYEKDLSVPLVDRANALKGVVFHERLGTSYEKIMRFTKLACYLGERVGFCKAMGQDENPSDFLQDSYRGLTADDMILAKAIIGRASMLSKADLMSDMVGEFPKLQGVMGAIYAKKSGEATEVTTAISEHYLPISAGGVTPASIPGAIISIADKMDTICGCFGAGLIPTGKLDPYALRRQALGIISIILEKDFKILLDNLVDKSLELLKDKLRKPSCEVKKGVLEFLKDRLKNQLIAQGNQYDTVDAVLSVPWYPIVDAVKRVNALSDFRSHPDYERLAIAFKRVSNILKGYDLKVEKPDRLLFEDNSEAELYSKVEEMLPAIEQAVDKGDYERVFKVLVSIKERIDMFFDKVLIMADDPAIRKNRLTMLNLIRNLYIEVADLSRLAV